MTTAVDRHAPIMRPAASSAVSVNQSTAVEQSRAVAEVQAAIVVAQQCPRNVATAIDSMREACKQAELAERAFFRFTRGGGTVSGASIHLARELARCWGNVQYGVKELRRDNDAGQSEMLAWAWDVQTNTRSETGFIVPHMRDKRGGPEPITDMRDIYENNANNGARRLREAIFGVLPTWYVEQAKELCGGTLANGGDKPIAQRIADCITAFEPYGVVRDRLERRIGRDSKDWTGHDVAQLGVIFKSIQRGEVTVEDEFPPERITADDIKGGGSTTPLRARKPTRGDEKPSDAAEPQTSEPSQGTLTEEPPGW